MRRREETDAMLEAIAWLLLLGIAAQWLAWRLGLPSILLLLVFGFFAGPDWLDLGIADLLGRELLLAAVSAAVAVILFEGGSILTLRDLTRHGRVVMRLVTVGAVVTFLLTTLAARALVGLSWPLAALLGAILIVSGPTVVLPLLRHVKPRGRIGPILTWEGITIDPVGAVVALLVFEGLQVGSWQPATGHAVLGLLRTVVVGGGIGLLAGFVLAELLRRYWIPDHLHIPVTLAMAVSAFVASNVAQHESGLLAVTIMGFYAANRGGISVRHILEFKENLRVLLISSLFLLLASRLSWADLRILDASVLLFLGALIVVVRPAAVWLATWGTDLTTAERFFLAWVCPRGIVAAAVASIFGLKLAEQGVPGAERLVPLTFVVIVGTVLVYGLTAGPLARLLGLSIRNPQGVLFVGAQSWARDVATALQAEGVPVLLVDSNRRNVMAARLADLPAHRGNALEEHDDERLDLAGMGRVLAVTPNDETNVLVAQHYQHLFGRGETYRLVRDTMPGPGTAPAPVDAAGRPLFAPEADYYHLSARCARGKVRVTALTEQFDWAAFQAEHGTRALPLFVLDAKGTLTVATAEAPLAPKAGDRILALVDDAPPAEEDLPPAVTGPPAEA